MRSNRLCTILLLLLGATCSFAQGDAPAAVELATVEAGATALPLRLSGAVTALRDASLSSVVTGVISDIRVDVGDRVAQGDVLLTIDSALAQRELARAQAAVDEARVQLGEARRLKAEANKLAETRNIPRSQADTRAAEALLAEAALTRSKAEADLVRERLARHQLRAPFAGVITQRSHDVGEWLDSSASALRLLSPADLVFDAQLPQERFADAAVGTAVQVRLDALPGQALSGTLRTLVPSADASSRSLLLRVQFNDLPATLIPGLSGRLQLADAGVPALQVPRDALLTRSDGQRQVVVAVGSGAQLQANLRDVEIGDALGPLVLIRAGLKAGERVVVRGNESLRDGQRLRAVDSSGR